MVEEENVDIRYYNVIYNAIKEVKDAMVGLMDSRYDEKVLGRAENIFPPPPGMSPEKAVGLPITQWRYQLHNSFEFFVFKKHPFLKKIKDTLYDEGAVYASLTGSGSAVYAIFDKPINLEHKFQDFLVWSKILK